jgi:hypothetical protein
VTLSLPPLLDAPPESDQLTDYDRTHLTTYPFLLDWSAGRGDWRKATEQLFGEEIAADPFRAKKAYDTHLARAYWMTHTGYRLLLGN